MHPSSDPSVSPADTPEVALLYRAITHLWYGKDRDAARVTLDELLSAGERDKAEIERLRKRLDECSGIEGWKVNVR